MTVRYVEVYVPVFYNARSRATPLACLLLQLFVLSQTYSDEPAMPRHVETRLRSFVFLAGGGESRILRELLPQSCG